MKHPSKIIVIGASSGIGRALVRLFAAKGHMVGAAARRTDLLGTLKEECGGKIYTQEMDVRRTEEAAVQFQTLVSGMGGADIVILNAGINPRDSDFNWQTTFNLLETNVLGFLALTNAAVKIFKAQGAGHLAGISSIAGLRGSGLSPSYSASKAHIANYMEGIRQCLAPYGIAVTDIRPGFVDTPMIADRKRRFWVSSPEKAAQQIYHAIEKKKRVVYVSRRWFLVALLFKLLPGRLYDFLYTRVTRKETQKK